MAGLFGGLFGEVLKGVEEVVGGAGKAVETAAEIGVGVAGGVVGGAGKAAETAAGIGVGVAGGVVVGAGKAVETVGEVVGGIGGALSGKKKEPEKKHGKKIEPEKKHGKKKEPEKKHGIKDVILDENKIEQAGKDDEKKYQHDYEDEDEAEKKLANWNTQENVILESNAEDQIPIPKYISLKSKHNNKYLRYVNDVNDNSDGLLRFSSYRVVSPYAKFEVRASKSETGLVHIRCCYNNKFWVRLSDKSRYIAAVADEEEEDQSTWSCTLFEPVFEYKQNAYRFRHVMSDFFLCIAESAPAPYTNCLVADTGVDALSSVFDWDAMFILPKYVAFKSDNGKYLNPSGVYLKFSAESVDDPSVAFEVMSNSDGFIRLKHVKSGKYWIRKPNWIHCKSIDTKKDDPNTLFWPIKVDNNIVAFRNMGNNLFCKRLTIDGKESCLNAAVQTIEETARLEVTEIVVARAIENVKYHLNNARVYGKKVMTMAEGIATNKTRVVDKINMKFRCEKKSEKTWSSSVTTTLGITTRITAQAPTMGKTKKEFSFGASSENTWGETEIEKSFEEITESVTVAPMSKVKLSGSITQASFDVPFSYTRRDTLKSGKEVTRRFEDGLFTGVTTMDFKFVTEKLPL